MLAAFTLFAALVAACGGGSSSESTGSSETSAETTEGEGEGGGGGEVSGKKIGYLDVAAAAPIEIRFQNAFKAAAEKLNWTVQLQDGAGEQEKTLTGARTLINSGVDAIVTSSVPAEWLQPVAAEAEAKEIPMINLITKASPGVFQGQVLEAQQAASEKMAEKVKEELPNGGEVALFVEEEILALVERAEILEEQFEGTNIKVVANINVPIAENPQVQKATVDTLSANPNLDAIIATSDIQTPEVLAGLRTAGNKKVKLFGYYADSANVKTMETNPEQFVAVVDSNIAEVSWIAAGELASFFTGGKITEIQEPEYTPVIVGPEDITPGMLNEEGPVPFEEIGAPFYEEWKELYGIE
ncbi:MAG: substrate-binding domain-containing protein [Solirubrobacterales bacterium]